jgi:hypothetical protein
MYDDTAANVLPIKENGERASTLLGNQESKNTAHLTVIDYGKKIAPNVWKVCFFNIVSIPRKKEMGFSIFVLFRCSIRRTSKSAMLEKANILH